MDFKAAMARRASAKAPSCGTDSSCDVVCRFRAAFYLLLSRAFSREADQETLKGIEQVSRGLMEAWGAMSLAADPDADTANTLLERFFSELRDQNIHEVVEHLAREYASLFLGVGPKTVALCESVYRSASGLLYQSAQFEVQQVYRESGMARSEEYLEPDDHIAIELSYMARLCETIRCTSETERAQALHYLELQRDFLKAHLTQWVPIFSERLIAAATSDFYRGMGLLLRAFIRIDTKLIDVMTEELKHNIKNKKSRRERPQTNHRQATRRRRSYV